MAQEFCGRSGEGPQFSLLVSSSMYHRHIFRLPFFPPSLFSSPCFFSLRALSLSSIFCREMAMAARCPSTAGVQTPSTLSPSRRRPAPSPIQRPHHHLRPLPRSSAARALQPPPKAEERSSLPRAFPVPANQQADPPPTPPSFTTAGMPPPPLPRLDLAGAGAVASSL